LGFHVKFRRVHCTLELKRLKWKSVKLHVTCVSIFFQISFGNGEIMKYHKTNGKNLIVLWDRLEFHGRDLKLNKPMGIKFKTDVGGQFLFDFLMNIIIVARC